MTTEKIPDDVMEAAEAAYSDAVRGGHDTRSFESRIEVIARAIMAEREREKWQPIETAPKNIKVLAAYQNGLGNWRIVTACYHTQLELSDEYGDHEEEYAPQGWYEESDSSEVIYQCSCKPTHWTPLPPYPQSK